MPQIFVRIRRGPACWISSRSKSGPSRGLRARSGAVVTREARLLASLNHPNIAAIYRMEESDGVRALVMELVPGETLNVGISNPPGAAVMAQYVNQTRGRGGGFKRAFRRAADSRRWMGRIQTETRVR